MGIGTFGSRSAQLAGSAIIVAAENWGPAGSETFPSGTHLCEVEIDEETGVVNLTRYTAVDDVGRVLNPLLCEGQIHGGIAQGIGQALLEDLVYDPDNG